MFHEKACFVFINTETAESNWQQFAYSRKAANRKRYFLQRKENTNTILEHVTWSNTGTYAEDCSLLMK